MPLFWLCLSFAAGIFLAAFLPISAWIWLAAAAIFLIAGWFEVHFCHRQSHPLLSKALFRIPFSLLVAFFALGGWRFQAAQPRITPQDLAWYASGKSVRVTGRIISYPEESASSTRAIFQARAINLNGDEIAVNGKFELRLPGGFNLAYGDVLELEGPLDAVLKDGGSANQSYLARRGIFSRMSYPQVNPLATGAGSPVMASIYKLREKAQITIFNQFPFPESALLGGILLGMDWNIPDYLQEAYRACGVIHIIAISGFNMALISGLIIRLTRHFLSPAKAGAAAIFTIVIYTLLVGGEPAVVRAAIMGSLAIPAHYFGRRVIALHSLVVVGAFMLAGNPFLLWDPSFQLSFLACLGLISMVDPIQQGFGDLIEKRHSSAARQWWQPIVILVTSTLVAQFAVSPVLLSMDPGISYLTLAANLALLPVQPLVMELGGLSTIIGLIFPSLGQLLAYAVWPFLAYCNRVALHFGMQPAAEIKTSPWLPRIALAVVMSTLLAFTIHQIRSFTTTSADPAQ